MRTRERRSGRSRAVSGIMIAPLVDIIFLLVLFFILNTSFRQERYIDIVLPESESSEDKLTDGIILSIRSDETLTLNNSLVTWDNLQQELNNLARDNQQGEVIIRGDENMPYKRAIMALDYARLAGFDFISLETVRSGGNP